MQENPLDFDYICYDTIAIHVSVQKCSLKYRFSSTNRKLRTSQSYSRRPAVFYLYLIIHFQAGNKNSEQPGLPIVKKNTQFLNTSQKLTKIASKSRLCLPWRLVERSKWCLKYRGSSSNRTRRTSQSHSRRQTVFYLYLGIHFQAGNKNSEQPGVPIAKKKNYTILANLSETDQNRLKE